MAVVFLLAVGSTGLANKTEKTTQYAMAVSAGPGMLLTTTGEHRPISTTAAAQHPPELWLICHHVFDLGFFHLGTNCAEGPSHATLAQRL